MIVEFRFCLFVVVLVISLIIRRLRFFLHVCPALFIVIFLHVEYLSFTLPERVVALG